MPTYARSEDYEDAEVDVRVEGRRIQVSDKQPQISTSDPRTVAALDRDPRFVQITDDPETREVAETLALVKEFDEDDLLTPDGKSIIFEGTGESNEWGIEDANNLGVYGIDIDQSVLSIVQRGELICVSGRVALADFYTHMIALPYSAVGGVQVACTAYGRRGAESDEHLTLSVVGNTSWNELTFQKSDYYAPDLEAGDRIHFSFAYFKTGELLYTPPGEGGPKTIR